MKKIKVLKFKKKLKKILITVICIITVFFSMPVKSNADAGILESIASFILMIPDGIQWLLNRYVSDETEDVASYKRISLEGDGKNDSGTLYNFEVTPYDIFMTGTLTDYGKYVDLLNKSDSKLKEAKDNIENQEIKDAITNNKEGASASTSASNFDFSKITTKNMTKMPILDANFFRKSTNDENNSADILRPVVSNVYNNLRNFVLILMLVILLYIGIRIIISSAITDQVKYKQYLIDWIVGICLVFLMQYIMSAIMSINQVAINMMSNQTPSEEYTIAFGPIDSKGASFFNKLASGANSIANPYKDGRKSDNSVEKNFAWIGTVADAVNVGSWIIRLNAYSAQLNWEAWAVWLNKKSDGWSEIQSDKHNDIENFRNRKLLISSPAIMGTENATWKFDKKTHTIDDYSASITGKGTIINAAIYNPDKMDEAGNRMRAVYFCNIAEFCRTITTFSSKYTHIYSVNKTSVMTDKGKDDVVDAEENDYESAAFWGYAFLYVLITMETVVFLYKYLKRVLWLAFLTMIAPLIALMYPVDRVGDGKAQTFNMWFKEYLFNTLIQPLHLLLYTIFLGAATTLIANNVIYGIAAYAFMIPAEKFFKKMFGFDKASTPGGLGSPAAGMMAMRGLDKLGGFGPHGKGGKTGNKENNIMSKLPMAKKHFEKNGITGGASMPTSSGVSTPNSGGAGSSVSNLIAGGNGKNRGNANTLTPSSLPKNKGKRSILHGMGLSIGSRLANRITGGKTSNLAGALKGEKLSMLKTGGRFVGRQLGKVGGLAAGTIVGAGIGAVSGALASALTGEDKFADAVQKGVLVGGASGFNRGGQLVDGINDGLENIYDEGRRYVAAENPAESAKIRRDDWVKQHQAELSGLSANEYQSKINFLDNYFQYADTDSISDIDQLDRIYDFCCDSNGNVDENKMESAIENEKAIKKFGDLDVGKNYDELHKYNYKNVDVSGVTLSEEDKHKASEAILKQNMRKRDEEIAKLEKQKRDVEEAHVASIANMKTGKVSQKVINKKNQEYNEQLDRLNNQIKYAKGKSVAASSEQLENYLKDVLENKQNEFRKSEADKKTEMQRLYGKK